MREQMLAGRAKYDAQFKKVLAPDQYTKFMALQADRMDRARDMRDTRTSPDVKKMKTKTTDSDKVKLKTD